LHYLKFSSNLYLNLILFVFIVFYISVSIHYGGRTVRHMGTKYRVADVIHDLFFGRTCQLSSCTKNTYGQITLFEIYQMVSPVADDGGTKGVPARIRP